MWVLASLLIPPTHEEDRLMPSADPYSSTAFRPCLYGYTNTPIGRQPAFFLYPFSLAIKDLPPRVGQEVGNTSKVGWATGLTYT